MVNIEEINKRYEFNRKHKEYEMKITKMAGHLADYHIDRAMESEDYFTISSYLIDYFSGSEGKSFDVGYLVTKYKEFGLNEKIEDIDFSVDEWYKIKYEFEHIENSRELRLTKEENELADLKGEEYVQYLIDQRKKDLNNDC
jgi:hypothetical protein